MIILLVLVFLGIPGCFSQDDQQPYQTCKRPFRCGAIPELTYPFWGDDRPSSCGHPGFQIRCEDGVPQIQILSVSYRVLEVDDSRRTLRVSRDDLWNTLCPELLFNTSLNTTSFNFYSPANDKSIALHYGCTLNNQLPPISLPNQFSCDVNDTRTSNFFQYPITDVWGSGNGIICNRNISVPVNEQAANTVALPQPGSTTTLQRAMEYGFWIHWTADEVKCRNCVQSGGLCGQNASGSGAFACHCSTGTNDSTCNDPQRVNQNTNGKGKSNSGTRIGLPIGGAVLAGLCLGLLFFYCWQKKKHRKRPLAAQTISKDITTPASSTPLSTPNSSNFTQSIPSYPSSNSDLGRGSSYFGVQVFNYTELEQATNNFNPSRELGEGGFGIVYYGELPDGRKIAVKRLYESNYRRVEQFMNEVKILNQLRHQNLVTLLGCTNRSQGLLLVYEYIQNGTVADHLHGKRAKSGLLSWPVRLNIAIETAEALAYLHKKEIVHRDVKTNNILLDNNFRVKVADFGLSRLFPTNVTHVSTAPQGTPGYVDPEYYQCYHLTEKSDVYSFGVVLIELITSLLAVDTNRHRHDINLANMAVNKIQNRALEEMVDSSLGFETNGTVRRMITLVAELAFQCLQQERDMRPSMEQVAEALKGIQNDDMNAQKVEVVDILVDGGDTGPLMGSTDLSS